MKKKLYTDNFMNWSHLEYGRFHNTFPLFSRLD